MDSTTMGLALTYRAHVVSRLAQRRIRASVTPYAETHVRLGTSLHVDEADVDSALEAVKALQG